MNLIVLIEVRHPGKQCFNLYNWERFGDNTSSHDIYHIILQHHQNELVQQVNTIVHENYNQKNGDILCAFQS